MLPIDSATPEIISQRPTGEPIVPAIVAGESDQAARRFVEFFTATIRNSHTRVAYSRAVGGSLPGARSTS